MHIRFCGNGGLGFRPYGGSLGEAPSNQALLPLSFGASLVLGMPSLRSCSVGPPRSAIHGRARLTRHPCRVAHCAEPPLGLPMGRAPPKPKRGGLPAGLSFEAHAHTCRSELAMDSRAPRLTSKHALSLTTIASKLAPTKGSAYTRALHHSSGRALARLQRLILIHPPLREAEWRCSSGEWRVAPFDAVEHAACRS